MPSVGRHFAVAPEGKGEVVAFHFDGNSQGTVSAWSASVAP